MKYIDADLLRKEVKRLEKSAHKSALGCADSETRKFYEGIGFAYQHIGVLIDSLHQEQPEADLEEEIDRFEDWMETYNQADYPTSFTTRDIARHFAEWQARQLLQGSPMPEDTVLFNKGVAEGRRLEREDTMKGMSNILAPDDPATNEEVKKLLQERKTMIEKEVQRQVFNEVEHCWEEAHHEGYVEGWNECEAAYKSK